jgi:hypothetical protein
MPKIKYKHMRFSPRVLAMIETCNGIIGEYEKIGLTLTLRQLYYQLVSRAIIPNTMNEYKKLIDYITSARLNGLVDWLAIEDRTRNVRELPHWSRPEDVVASAAYSFRIDKWLNQKYRPIVMIEKDALLGILQAACPKEDVPYFSCRGYSSISEMWNIAQMFNAHLQADQTPYLIHLGDHDPSGIDMSRDLTDRLGLFLRGDLQHAQAHKRMKFKRIALNMEQIRKHKPPPNPAKITDSRYKSYMKKFGASSWELDALDAKMLIDLIGKTIRSVRDNKQWEMDSQEEQKQKDLLHKTVRHWPKVAKAVHRYKDPKKKQ